MSKSWTPAKSALEELGDISKLSLDTMATSSRPLLPEAVPLVPAIYHSSTYKIRSVQDYLDILRDNGYIYGRLSNPNCESVECVINDIEGGAGCLTFSSGMAAISAAFLCFLKAGDHVICQNPCYSGTFDVLDKILKKYGVETSWVQAGCGVSQFEKSIKPNTKLMVGETICNPVMSLLDIEEFGKLGTTRGIMTMVDNTFASPYCQAIIKYGIDICMHSCTKYLGGHSDLTAGCLTFKDVSYWKEMKRYQTSLGMVLSPHEANLLLRGIKTLHVRMPRHCSNAQKVAEYLEKHDKVESVRYPGLASHPQHELAVRQMTAYSGMLAVEVKGGMEAGRTFVENVRLAHLAVSLGGVETLLEHPATMTHGPMIMSDQERKEAEIGDGLVRISIGLENADDLIEDFEQALDKVQCGN